MILFPAIDLIAGQVVRLRQGDRSQMDVYATDPVAVARDFAARGARWIHVVDLSATFGEDEDALSKNAAAIRGICQVEGISVDTGGGVRDMAAIERLAEAGAKRIALGTALVRDPGFAREAAERYGDLLVADVVNAYPDSEPIKKVISSIAKREENKVQMHDQLGYTRLYSIDADAYRHIAEVAGFPVVASGGIATLDDVRLLAALGPDVIEGAITGRALYEGSLDLGEALAVAHAGEAADARA